MYDMLPACRAAECAESTSAASVRHGNNTSLPVTPRASKLLAVQKAPLMCGGFLILNQIFAQCALAKPKRMVMINGPEKKTSILRA
jgi:hypothetical protein